MTNQGEQEIYKDGDLTITFKDTYYGDADRDGDQSNRRYEIVFSDDRKAEKGIAQISILQSAIFRFVLVVKSDNEQAARRIRDVLVDKGGAEFKDVGNPTSGTQNFILKEGKRAISRVLTALQNDFLLNRAAREALEEHIKPFYLPTRQQPPGRTP